MVQNSARLSGLPCTLAHRWLSRVIRALIRADMIKGEPASGPASWALGLGWQGPRLHQPEKFNTKDRNSHGDAGQWTWVAIAPLRFGHSELMWGFRAVQERVYRSFITSMLWTRIWTLLWLAENYDELMAVFLLMIICRLNVPVENRDLWLFPPCLFNLTIASYPSSVHQAVKNLVKIRSQTACSGPVCKYYW